MEYYMRNNVANGGVMLMISLLGFMLLIPVAQVLAEAVVDITAPTGYVEQPSEYGEVSGTALSLRVNTNDMESLVKDVCLQYRIGDETTQIGCKLNDERDSNSYNYAASFQFNWDMTGLSDGTYYLFAVMTDNANNVGTTSEVSVTLNNVSTGSAVNPAEITNCAELQDMDNHLSWHYRLMNDIDCSETVDWDGGKGFDQIGNESKGFVGSLDGQNYTISNLFQNQTGNSGLFYYLYGSVQNVNLRDVDIKCNSTYCGGFTYLLSGSIDQSSITGQLRCSGKCGGFTAQNSGTINESWGDMNIGNGGYSGGIAGQNYGGKVINTYFKGSINANNGGGIVGLNENTNVTHTYSTAKIADNGYNGAMIGWQYSGGNQTGSYWDAELSGIDNMCGTNGTNCDDSHGLTTAEMKTQSSFVGWDFEDIWAISEDKNDGYPYLQWQTSFTQSDTEAPVITLVGNIAESVLVGAVYTDAGATAQDNVDGDITSLINIDNTVNTAVAGVYTVTYSVQDAAENVAVPVVRTVTVREEESDRSGGGSSATRISSRTQPQLPPAPVATATAGVDGQVLGESTFNFTENLYEGVSGEQVRELQKHLRQLGLFTHPTDTGYFGPITKAAVMQYQALRGIVPAIGFVGPLTRAELNS